MGVTAFQPRGRQFSGFTGDQIVTAGRRRHKSDISRISGLAGDFTQIHTDAAFAAEWLFGEALRTRPARSLRGQVKLSLQTGMMEGTVLSSNSIGSSASRS